MEETKKDRPTVTAEVGGVRSDAPTAELPPANLQSDTTPRRYRIEALVGRGAFGEVLRAYDEVLQRAVALKVVPLSTADYPQNHLDQLLSEARIIAKLEHPHIVPVYDAGLAQSGLWIAMKLIPGRDLEQALMRGSLDRSRTVAILRQVAEALDHAHRLGVVHRDIKPSNILVQKKDGEAEYVWLTDFGLSVISTAKSSQQGYSVAGTPGYMAPEQITGKRVDGRADIFALGCVAIKLITGKNAFPSEPLAEACFAVVHNQPDGLREVEALAGNDFARVVSRWLAKSPEDRPQSMRDVLQDLDHLAGIAPARVFRIGRWLRLGRRITDSWDGQYVLRVEGLHKGYRLRRPVLKGVNLNVRTGSIYGLLGRNGSGKTTLIRTILGIYRPRVGTVSVFGRDPRKRGREILRRTGVVSENLHAYEWLKVNELLEFVSRFYDAWDRPYCYQLLSRFDLPLNVRLRNLSRGQQTQISLVCAMGHRPEFLVLDDPTVGLDAVILEDFVTSLKEVAQRDGTTVLIASHNHEDLEQLITDVGFLHQGEMLFSTGLETLKNQIIEVKLTFSGEIPVTENIPRFRNVRSSGRQLTGVILDRTSSGLDELKRLGPAEIETRQLSLREIFVNYLRESMTEGGRN